MIVEYHTHAWGASVINGKMTGENNFVKLMSIKYYIKYWMLIEQFEAIVLLTVALN